jgi:peptidoglycan hydrolase-like protein with peptidoglycan-binding domain
LEVKDVKKILSQLGYYNGPFDNEPNDVYFQAVTNFQHAKAITQDELVGGETYGKLREAAPWYFGDKGQTGDNKQQAQSQNR